MTGPDHGLISPPSMADENRDPGRAPRKRGHESWSSLGGAVFSYSPYHPTPSPLFLIILGAVIFFSIIGFFVVFYYLPTRPLKLSRRGRMRKHARQVRFARKREEWMDLIGQTELKARDRRNLAKHLSSVCPELRRKAAKILREKGGPENLREVEKQLSERGDPDLVADAIISAQWSEMEPALLPMIDGKARIAVAAISAMAEVGGRASLSALLAQEGRPDLALAREQAIVRLQKRLEGQNVGQVSLAEGADKGGALGIPKE